MQIRQQFPITSKVYPESRIEDLVKMNVGWKVESNNGKIEAVLIHNINAYLFDGEEIDEPSHSEESSDALLVMN